MGLDMLDIMLDVEKRLRVSLDNDDVAGLVTVGDLYHALRRKRPAGPRRDCPTAAAFYRLRRAMVSTWGLARGEIRPGRRLDALLPRRRRAAWERLATATGLRLPALRRPRWVVRGVWGLAWLVLLAPPAVYGGAAVYGGWSLLDLPFILAGLLLILLLPFALVAYCGWVLSGLLAWEFGPECQTVGALARAVIAHNSSAFADAPPDPADPLWQDLLEIISRCTGVRPERITPESRWVRDLGC